MAKDHARERNKPFHAKTKVSVFAKKEEGEEEEEKEEDGEISG